MKGFKPIIDPDTGKITGYKTTIGGADTVFPFNSRKEIEIQEISTGNISKTVDKLPENIYVATCDTAGIFYVFRYTTKTGIESVLNTKHNYWRDSISNTITVSGNTITYKKASSGYGGAIMLI